MELVVDRISVDRGERRIVSGADFSVGEGRAVVITGANGSGKSTLLKAIAGLLKPAEGIVALNGAGEGAVGEHCHYLGHDNALKAALSVAENLLFWQGFLGRGVTPETALSAVGLGGTGDLPAGCLSAGQKRRVAIARLLTTRRAVWLLDEPTAALDNAAQDRFARLAADHLSGGGIVVAATHQELGLGTADRIDMADYGPERAK